MSEDTHRNSTTPRRIDDASGAYLAAALLWAATNAEHPRARKAICRASLALAERCGVAFSDEIATALEEGRIDDVLRNTGVAR